MKVLFDSNVHISDAIFGGAAARAITGTLQARWKIFVCQTILTEVDRIIRIRFHRSRHFTSSTIQNIRDTSEIIGETQSRHHVAGDPDDTPILRAAVAAGVDYLVTGDSELLAMNPVEGVRIITIADYLDILRAHGFARN